MKEEAMRAHFKDGGLSLNLTTRLLNYIGSVKIKSNSAYSFVSILYMLLRRTPLLRYDI